MSPGVTRRLPVVPPRIAVLFAALTVAACSSTSLVTGTRDPKPCALVYNVARCEALTDLVAADIGKDRDDVVSVAIVPDAPPGGVHLGAGWHVRVRIALEDGSTHDKEVCGGVVHEPACLDTPRLEVRSAISAGYTDVPAGSTPLPTLDASALGAASPLVIDALSIAIDRKGPYQVDLGEASLPNGRWTVGSLDLGEPWPDDLALRDAIVTLDLESLEDDGSPFGDAYRHGWRAGVERVLVRLRFDVLWFRPGATLELRNVEVR